MESTFSNARQALQSLNFSKLTLSHPSSHESPPQHSQIRGQAQFEQDNYSFLNSLSLKYLPISYPHDSKVFPGEHLGSFLESERVESSLPYLSLSRGFSQSYEYFQDDSYYQCMPYAVLQNPSERQDMQQEQESRPRAVSATHPSYLSQPISEQELKSDQKNNDFSQYSSPEGEMGKSASRVGLKVTKNVTKNIGKLLFKFIWKHRKTLGQQLKVEKSHWESFMKVISLWKKQNNITRQYLIQRWHGEGQHCALFRTLSRHFFRKRCLPDIMKSHIRLKRVHYERIPRFSAAITDPQALSSIA